MSLSLQMRFDEAKSFFQNAQIPAHEKITLSFDDNNLDFVQELRRQKALNAIQSFCGSGVGNHVEELLKERQQDREKDW